MLDLTANEWLQLFQPTKSLLTQISFDKRYWKEFNAILPDLKKEASHLFESDPNSRFVIRLSGTENYIRVFIESDNCIELNKQLEPLIMERIKDFA